MARQVSISLAFLAAIASACGGSLKTGTVSRPDASSPEDPACPNDHTVCGTGPAAVCTNLQNDPEHCGSCMKACAPGVACASGVCQRVLCQGQPLLSETPLTGTPSSDYAFSSGAVLADVNGDGHPDLVSWYTPAQRDLSRPGSFTISLGQAGGGFASPQSYATDAMVRWVQVADVNHDGADDLFILEYGPLCRELWLGHSDGPLTLSPEFAVVDCGWAMAVADISGDGYFDMVAVSEDKAEINVYLSGGDGALRSERAYAAPLPVAKVVVKDWNGDGSPDLVLLGSSLQLLTNRGNGTFEDAVDCGIVADDTGMVIADLNHDGHMDLASKGHVQLGLGGCQFGPVAIYDVATGYALHRFADMDGDGQLDLLCLNFDGVFTGLLGNPDGSFQAATPITLVGYTGRGTLLVGDVTGDQRPDLVLANGLGAASVWENTCP